MAIAAVALSGLWRKPTFSEGVLSPAQAPGGFEGRLHQNTHAQHTDCPVQQNPRRPAGQIASGDAASPWLKRRGRRRRGPRKWHEKRVDSEFDMVIVPSDGISMSGSDSEDSDWSVGWFEPHHSDFTENELEDSFAVLVPCYGSPSPPIAGAPQRFPFQSEEPKAPVWANVLANLSRQTSEEHQQHLERWLAGL